MHRAIQEFHGLGKKAGVALNPSTPSTMLSEALDSIQLVLVMSVDPGFGGQQFIPQTLPKIRQVRQEISRRNLNIEVEVDGGIDLATAPLVVEAGAGVLVAGSAVFGPQHGVAVCIRRLRASAAGIDGFSD